MCNYFSCLAVWNSAGHADLYFTQGDSHEDIIDALELEDNDQFIPVQEK